MQGKNNARHFWRNRPYGSGPTVKQALPAACILNGRKEPQPLPSGVP